MQKAQLLHVKFHLIDWNFNQIWSRNGTDSQLYVVISRHQQGLGEVGRVVEFTAATDTVQAIPQWGVRIESPHVKNPIG